MAIMTFFEACLNHMNKSDNSRNLGETSIDR